MDIGKIDCGAWLVLSPTDEKVGEVKFRILPLPTDYQFPKTDDVKIVIEEFARFITGWNLETDSVAIPCTDENKAKYLSYLLRLEVKGIETDAKEIAVVSVARFAADIDNFLGN